MWRFSLLPVLLMAVGSRAVGQPVTPSTAYVRESWTVADGLPINTITSLVQTRDGYLWLGTNDGVVRFDGVRFTVYNAGNTPEIPSNRIVSLHEDRAGALWILTEQQHLIRYARGQFTHINADRGLKAGAIRLFAAIPEHERASLAARAADVRLRQIERLTGRGVCYGAALTEALGLRGRRVHIVGGGNSVGQAAMLFSSYAESVTMPVRGPSVAASMSQYVISQLATKANVTVETQVEVMAVEGPERLEALELAAGPSRKRERRASDALFVFIGAQAEASWLPAGIIRNRWGYICTGRDAKDLLGARDPGVWPLDRDPFLLETSVPGIFAARDVRHGSIKRVASSVGAGSMAIAFGQQYLAEIAQTASVALSG